MALVFGVPLGVTAAGLPLASAFQQSQFQTAWFVESLCTQTLVVFVIRTRQSPFWKSKPGKYLLVSSLSVVAAAILIPYTPLGKYSTSHLCHPCSTFFTADGCNLPVLAEVVKRWFYKRHAFRIEQTLVPKRKTRYLSGSARLIQDVAAVVCLRPENEISLDSMIDDLSRSLNYPIDADRVYQSLQYLRRGGLVEVDWHERVIKRTGPIKEYITKRVAANGMWALVYDDWLRINSVIQEKYGKSNPDFQDLLSPKQR